MPLPFRDRQQAGRELAGRLMHYAHRSDVIVLGLPRGGIPVAAEVARALAAPLDVFVVRKLGVPGHEELAMGAIASGNVQVLNEDIVGQLGISPQAVQQVADEERAELERRERAYRPAPPPKGPAELANRIVILIDDGLATGATMRAAAAAVRQKNPARTIIAVPVAAAETCDLFRPLVDEIICPHTPEPFQAVGLWYEDFSQTTDEEVRALLQAAQDTAST